MRVLAISGSLRAASHNTALLRAAAELAPDGVEVELYEGLDRLPPYNEDHDTEDPPALVADLREQIAGADALLISTPEYNGTVPGQLKHAVDWASRPYGQGSSLWGKPVAVIGASVTDYGALWAQDHMRKALGIAGARVLEAELPVGKAQHRFAPDGELTDAETAERLGEIVAGLVEHRHRLLQAAA
jgi:chromate reductase, NAD(P)H dehydrogenase (quinone)